MMQSDRRSPDSAAVTLLFVPIRNRGMQTPDTNIPSYANYSSHLVKKKKKKKRSFWEGKAREAPALSTG